MQAQARPAHTSIGSFSGEGRLWWGDGIVVQPSTGWVNGFPPDMVQLYMKLATLLLILQSAF